jgi:hypothetical protein
MDMVPWTLENPLGLEPEHYDPSLEDGYENVWKWQFVAGISAGVIG